MVTSLVFTSLLRWTNTVVYFNLEMNVRLPGLINTTGHHRPLSTMTVNSLPLSFSFPLTPHVSAPLLLAPPIQPRHTSIPSLSGLSRYASDEAIIEIVNRSPRLTHAIHLTSQTLPDPQPILNTILTSRPLLLTPLPHPPHVFIVVFSDDGRLLITSALA